MAQSRYNSEKKLGIHSYLQNKLPSAKELPELMMNKFTDDYATPVAPFTSMV